MKSKLYLQAKSHIRCLSCPHTMLTAPRTNIPSSARLIKVIKLALTADILTTSTRTPRHWDISRLKSTQCCPTGIVLTTDLACVACVGVVGAEAALLQVLPLGQEVVAHGRGRVGSVSRRCSALARARRWEACAACSTGGLGGVGRARARA